MLKIFDGQRKAFAVPVGEGGEKQAILHKGAGEDRTKHTKGMDLTWSLGEKYGGNMVVTWTVSSVWFTHLQFT